MYVCVYIYIYIYIYTHAHIYTHTYMHACMYVCMYIYIIIYIYIHRYTHTHTHTHIYIVPKVIVLQLIFFCSLHTQLFFFKCCQISIANALFCTCSPLTILTTIIQLIGVFLQFIYILFVEHGQVLFDYIHEIQ